MNLMKINQQKLELDKKFEAIKNLINEDLKKGLFDDEVVVLALSDNDTELYEIFTKKRMELVKAIKEHRPKNIKELALKVKRLVPAVHRDLTILAKYSIIKLEKSKHGLTPRVIKKFIKLNLDILSEDSIWNKLESPNIFQDEKLKKYVSVFNKLDNKKIDDLLSKKRHRVLLYNLFTELTKAYYLFDKKLVKDLVNDDDKNIKKQLKRLIIGSDDE